MNHPTSHPQTPLQTQSLTARLITARLDPWVLDDEVVRKVEIYTITLTATLIPTMTIMEIVLGGASLSSPKPSHVNEVPTPMRRCPRSGNGERGWKVRARCHDR